MATDEAGLEFIAAREVTTSVADFITDVDPAQVAIEGAAEVMNEIGVAVDDQEGERNSLK